MLTRGTVGGTGPRSSSFDPRLPPPPRKFRWVPPSSDTDADSSHRSLGRSDRRVCPSYRPRPWSPAQWASAPSCRRKDVLDGGPQTKFLFSTPPHSDFGSTPRGPRGTVSSLRPHPNFRVHGDTSSGFCTLRPFRPDLRRRVRPRSGIRFVESVTVKGHRGCPWGGRFGGREVRGEVRGEGGRGREVWGERGRGEGSGEGGSGGGRSGGGRSATCSRRRFESSLRCDAVSPPPETDGGTGSERRQGCHPRRVKSEVDGPRGGFRRNRSDTPAPLRSSGTPGFHLVLSLSPPPSVRGRLPRPRFQTCCQVPTVRRVLCARLGGFLDCPVCAGVRVVGS